MNNRNFKSFLRKSGVESNLHQIIFTVMKLEKDTSSDMPQDKTVESTFYSTSKTRVGNYYKPVSKIW